MGRVLAFARGFEELSFLSLEVSLSLSIKRTQSTYIQHLTLWVFYGDLPQEMCVVCLLGKWEGSRYRFAGCLALMLVSGRQFPSSAYFVCLCRYEIMNYQRLETENGSYYYDYVQVGAWDSGNLTMKEEIIQWPHPVHNDGKREVESICSKPCENGKVKVS